ncbi:type IV pilin protein [Allohahella marinimesophila]|uniref:Type IV pilin protein n=1 Tax=Allohahella marinimesophila TaxID=1054972 RepID=A0ABP7NNS3_9GAMM
MRQSKGFTLIELMIVVAIVGILAAVAYPAYRDSVMKSHRADAKAELLRMATAQEKFFSRSGSYARTVKELGYSAPAASSTLNFNEHYDISVSNSPAASAGNAVTYTLTANAKAGQLDDKCDGLSINSIGAKGVTEGDNKTCWDR